MVTSDEVELGSVFTWREARAAGARRRQVTAAGRRISTGLYVAEAEEDTLRTRCLAWSRLLPRDAAFGLETAALLQGIPVPRRPCTVQVVVRPRPVLPQRRGLTVHVRSLTAADVVEVDGLVLTAPAQLFLDLAPRLPVWDLVAAGDALLRTAGLDAAALTERLARADRVRGVVRARGTAPLLDGRAASPPESQVRYWLLASDLPDPRPQLPVRDRSGRVVAHGDLGYEEWKVLLEYEGRQHAAVGQFGRDIDRYSLMAADGWSVLRFGAAHARSPDVVVGRTRRALESRGWRP